MVKKPLTNEEFLTLCVRTAMAGQGYDELVEKTGMARGSIIARVFKLRQKGIDIPPFKRTYPDVDVAALNALSKKLQAEIAGEQKKAKRK